MNPVVKNISSHAAYALWQIEGATSELTEKHSTDLPLEIQQCHPQKKVEFIASRILLEQLCVHMNTPFDGLDKDEAGKPSLSNSDFHVSITHSFPLIAVMINKLQPCGIDIEKPREQLLRIQHKFLNEQEIKQAKNDLNVLCQYWCAKEVLYKIYGRKKLSLAGQLSVSFTDTGSLRGEIHKDKIVEKYDLNCEKVDKAYLVYSL